MANEHATYPGTTSDATTIRAADNAAVTARGPVPRRVVDKQSTEYIIKSGIAGGLAGCAVSLDSLNLPHDC